MSLRNIHDTTHDMYQPKRRAKATPPRIAKPPARSTIPPVGDRAGRQAWMRARQQAQNQRRI